MNTGVLAIFDSEERYARGLMEFLSQKGGLPFRIHVFTDGKKFYEYASTEKIDCLLLSEKEYSENTEKLNIAHLIILSETNRIVDSTLKHIQKYQSLENIYKELLNEYSEYAEAVPAMRTPSTGKMKIIGIYTPIGRCLQTTFSITLGQILSKKGRALYMNFERYSGFSQMLRRSFSSDISDLMYYFECAKEKLSIRIESITEKIGDLEFIPPAEIYQNLSGISAEQWIDLFSEMEKCTDYEYLILDLTDGMLNLWDVLRFCDCILTISKNDGMALAKITQYERALECSQYEDVIGKTRKCRLPVFKDIKQGFEDLTRSDLARYIREEILPIIEETDR